ncbi:cytochrome ubiquinol oxidase subunit I [Kocuria rhizophila]|uniref:cytochrome ubiquinol oxidase subunit I n=1 Tax=Kocuria rhizophila TaxID=72000 RepID=UPI000ED381BE|nr:cytochrome ubiquinol oxidase subunit I [Kocuria sp.]
MDPLDIARWQFGITTVYHFVMVPLTLGLGLMVVVFQLMWLRTGREHWLRMTKFWGKLYLINFIMGVATGLVQEFQFGMAWSEYSRFVGDVFGAPLAMEGLFAFFVESTFLGLWIFGWDKLRKSVHTACLVIAVAASWASAYFIIVANSWMQHPVGVEMRDGHPVMTDVWAVLTNNTALTAVPHAWFGACSVAAGFLVGISWYHLYKRRSTGVDRIGPDGRVLVGEVARGGRDATDHRVWLTSLRIGAVVGMVAFAGTAATGDVQGKLMFEQQPLKMASAEAACEDTTSFSVFSLGSPGSNNCQDVTPVLEIPGLLSFLAHSDFTTDVKGINTLQPEYEERYGTQLPENPLYGERSGVAMKYSPDMAVTYWGFRLMIGLGGISAFSCLVALWLTRRGTVPGGVWLMRLAVFGILAPFAANIAGWIFTELGRQPFVVAPNPSAGAADGVYMFTAAAVSPGVSGETVLFSTIALTAVYAVLAVVEIALITVFVRGGVPSAMPQLARESHDDSDGSSPSRDSDDVLAFAY